MRPRTTAQSRPKPAVREVWLEDEAHPAGDGYPAHGGADHAPVIVLSYAYSGAASVQEALALGTDLACTSGTGILPLCAVAAETWQRVDGRSAQTPSPLAAASIRGMITAQVTAILATAGKTRWCELATASPDAAASFLQLFPQTLFICVHRSCLDVVRAAMQANPWGTNGQGLTPYFLAYPGNNVAALAAYWADAAEQLIVFQEVHRGSTQSLRFEDINAHPDQALISVRAALHLVADGQSSAHLGRPRSPETRIPLQVQQGKVPLALLPSALLERINVLHTRLGYPQTDEEEAETGLPGPQ
jgi:hypothetical protein